MSAAAYYCPTCAKTLRANEVDRVEFVLVHSACGSEVDELELPVNDHGVREMAPLGSVQ